MDRLIRIANLRASINAMQATLRELLEEERVDKRRATLPDREEKP